MKEGRARARGPEQEGAQDIWDHQEGRATGAQWRHTIRGSTSQGRVLECSSKFLCHFNQGNCTVWFGFKDLLYGHFST